MATDIINASVAEISIGSIVFEGLKTEDGRYAIAYQQIASLFQLLQNEVQLRLERLLGEDASLYTFKVKTNREKVEGKRVRGAENALLIDGFRKLIRKLDKQGHPVAGLLVDVLTGVSLDAFFADGFKDERTPENRQEVANRILDEAIRYHPLFGDNNVQWAADFLKCNRNSVKMAKFFMTYVYCTLSKEEVQKLNQENPIINGQRKQAIHQWLAPHARIEHKQYFDAVLVLVKAARTEQEFNETWRRVFRDIYQQDLEF